MRRRRRVVLDDSDSVVVRRGHRTGTAHRTLVAVSRRHRCRRVPRRGVPPGVAAGRLADPRRRSRRTQAVARRGPPRDPAREQPLAASSRWCMVSRRGDRRGRRNALDLPTRPLAPAPVGPSSTHLTARPSVPRSRPPVALQEQGAPPEGRRRCRRGGPGPGRLGRRTARRPARWEPSLAPTGRTTSPSSHGRRCARGAPPVVGRRSGRVGRRGLGGRRPAR